MATTYAITALARDTTGSKRRHSGVATGTGTYAATDNITAAALGLHTIEGFQASCANEATPLAFEVRPVVAANKQSVVIRLFGTNATPGAAVPDPQVTAGTATTGYFFDFEATGT